MNTERERADAERKRGNCLFALAIMAAVCVVALISTVAIFAWVARLSREVRSVRHTLLHEVDHLAVRDAGRELLGRLERETYRATAPRLPAAIAKLHPVWTRVEPDEVHIEFGGGFHHQGLIVRQPGSEPGPPGTGHRYQKLVEGLWFYEDTR
jgi:hypothetical protein